MCGLLCLASFTQEDVFEAHLCYNPRPTLIPSYGQIKFILCVARSHSAYPLICRETRGCLHCWAVSNDTTATICEHVFTCGRVLSILLGVQTPYPCTDVPGLMATVPNIPERHSVLVNAQFGVKRFFLSVPCWQQPVLPTSGGHGEVARAAAGSHPTAGGMSFLSGCLQSELCLQRCVGVQALASFYFSLGSALCPESCQRHLSPITSFRDCRRMNGIFLQPCGAGPLSRSHLQEDGPSQGLSSPPRCSARPWRVDGGVARGGSAPLPGAAARARLHPLAGAGLNYPGQRPPTGWCGRYQLFEMTTWSAPE